MDMDIFEKLPPPAISMSLTNSWSGSMSKYMNLSEEGLEEIQQYGVERQERIDSGPRPRLFGVGSGGTIMLERSSYSHVRTGTGDTDWLAVDEERQHNYYYTTPSITTSDNSDTVSLSPTSTATNYPTYSMLDDMHNSGNSVASEQSGYATQSDNASHASSRRPVIFIPDVTPDGLESAGVPKHLEENPLYSTISPYPSTSHTPFHSETHSPLLSSVYSSPVAASVATPSPLPTSPLKAEYSFMASNAPSSLHSPSPSFGEVLQDEHSPQFVNMSDVYSPAHSEHDSIPVAPQHISPFDGNSHTYHTTEPATTPLPYVSKTFPRYSPPPPHVDDGESEFGYLSPFREIEDTWEIAIGSKRSSMEAGFDDKGSLKKARTSAKPGTKRGRGRPRKPVVQAELQEDPLNGSVSSVESAQESGEEEVDGDSDVYVPSDGSNYGGSSRRRKGSGPFGRRKSTGSGNAEALRELERRVRETGAEGEVGAEKAGTGAIMGYSCDQDSSLAGGSPRQQEYRIRRRSNPRILPVPVPNLTKKSRGRKVPTTGVQGGDDGVYGSSAAGDSDEYDTAPSAGAYNLRTRRSSLQVNEPDLGIGSSTEMGVQRGRPSRAQYNRDSGDDDYLGYGLDGDMFGMSTLGAGQAQQPSLGFQLPPNIVSPTETFKRVSGGIKKSSGERRYVCTADGCGKCFVRGEHLKRHVRSLHTWEKRESPALSPPHLTGASFVVDCALHVRPKSPSLSHLPCLSETRYLLFGFIFFTLPFLSLFIPSEHVQILPRLRWPRDSTSSSSMPSSRMRQVVQ
ncbi:hypothetical protein VNI00_009160 [Paramarasmius palmivorus]|uniref:C2H2-type domain-containing protein n=1 Tax=Paramarasmius palmivorus TaxID=297713 RepID=A0AAW0CRW3_9AGAR